MMIIPLIDVAVVYIMTTPLDRLTYSNTVVIFIEQSHVHVITQTNQHIKLTRYSTIAVTTGEKYYLPARVPIRNRRIYNQREGANL